MARHLENMRAPKEGATASSKAWQGRSLSTMHPEKGLVDTGPQARMQGIDTGAISVKAGSRVAVVHGGMGIVEGVRLQSINTSAISIGARTRLMVTDADFRYDAELSSNSMIFPDGALTDVHSDVSTTANAARMQGMDTSAISISATARSLIINADAAEDEQAPRLQGIDASAIAISATARVAVVHGSATEAESDGETAPRLQGIDISAISIKASTEVK